ncbi:hypothetical protein BSF41_13090 [Flavobacterium sp. ACN2]|uniref:hypothetical protein n=1 Tax=Flavobacterium sp. ACN2 TaxID=1975676 RepID=UPI001142F639|nr:hypothetical protein [Flavobacterium sp. ACN2]PBI91705.1 hypothetical protein BSF41_13090 [Flavobacterium sp. ACN2]
MNNIFIALLLFASFIMKGQNIRGKFFVAQTGIACKEYSGGGGCEMRYYCYLEFQKKYVNVFYRTIYRCSPKEMESTYDSSPSKIKKYMWKKEGRTISINGFTDYDVLKIESGKLIGTKKINYQQNEIIEFKEEPCQKK